MRVRLHWIALMFCAATPLLGQDTLANAVAAMDRHDLVTARTLLESTLQGDPHSYEANWRLAHVLVDQGKVTPDSVKSASRDSLYQRAVSYARRAVAANPDGPDGHFILAAALGRWSLTLGSRERIRVATEIRSEALRALALDPGHSGAYHVLGRWHAEVRRLSATQRFVARTILGGRVLRMASWDEAERNMRLAVEHGPDRIYHRLDLALVLIDRHKPMEAQAQLDTILQMPPREPMDSTYQRDASRLLRRISGEDRQ